MGSGQMKKLIAALIVCAVPGVAIAQKTPKLDVATDAIKESLWRKGMSTAPTQMYLAARAELRNEICGRPKEDDEIKMYLRTAAVEAPEAVVQVWYLVFKTKMKGIILENPDEAVEFCK